MIMRNLIVPVAADKYDEGIYPPPFKMGDDGIMYCIKAAMGKQHSFFDKIYFTILKKHDKAFFLKELFNIQFRRLGISEIAKVVILNEPTKNQPETVLKTIVHEKIKGFVMIKDADSDFDMDIEEDNSIAVYPLDNMVNFSLKDKSYVSINDDYYVTNIIEKKVLGRYFSTGGYCFSSAQQVVDEFEKYKHESRLYMSHLIYSLLLEKHVFRAVVVKNFADLDV